MDQTFTRVVFKCGQVNLNNVLIHLVPPAVSRGWTLKVGERESRHQKAQEMKVTRILVVYKDKVPLEIHQHIILPRIMDTNAEGIIEYVL